MNILRPLLFPITAAWFIGILWWVGQRDGSSYAMDAGHDHGVNTEAAIMHFGPRPVARSTEAIRPDPMVIPFVKNEQGTGVDVEMEQRIVKFKAALEADPEAWITITGHTDADGDADLNVALSLERAEAIRMVLEEQGVPSERIRTVGMGAERPISDNYTSKGKAKNRRVEVVLDRPTP